MIVISTKIIQIVNVVDITFDLSTIPDNNTIGTQNRNDGNILNNIISINIQVKKYILVRYLPPINSKDV